MSQSPLLNLSLMQSSQGQKHITHNEALMVLDGLVQLAVLSCFLDTPPDNPQIGDRYLVAGGGQQEWEGHGAAVTRYSGEEWVFHSPRVGWLAWVIDEERLIVFDGEEWRDLPEVFDTLGVNATADTYNRFAVCGPASLFDGGTGGHSLKVNKAMVGDAAGLMFQSDYSGRAELGLIGSDDLQIKVSANGTDWSQAVVIDRATGHVGIGKVAGPMRLDVSGGIRAVSASASFLQMMNTGPGGAQAWIGIPDWNRSAFYIYGGASDITTMYDTPTRSHRLFAGGSERIRIASGGDVGIGTSSPTTRLHVAGPVRTGSYLKAALPSAATVGAGTLAYVQDAAGGAQFAYSDGTQWLKMRDGNPV